MAGNTTPASVFGRAYHEHLEIQLSQAAQIINSLKGRSETQQQHIGTMECQLAHLSDKLNEATQVDSQRQSELLQLKELVTQCNRQLEGLTRDKELRESQLAQAEQQSDQMQRELSEAAARELELHSRIEDLEHEAELKDVKASSDCLVSLAFASADTRRNYQQAVEAFLAPLERKYIMRHEILDSPQPCKFLIWAIACAGRLPNELTELEAFRKAASCQHALVLVLRRGLKEENFTAILPDKNRCSGIFLGGQSEDRRLLQVLTYGDIGCPQPLLDPSTLNNQNLKVLEELLSMTLPLAPVPTKKPPSTPSRRFFPIPRFSFPRFL